MKYIRYQCLTANKITFYCEVLSVHACINYVHIILHTFSRFFLLPFLSFYTLSYLASSSSELILRLQILELLVVIYAYFLDVELAHRTVTQYKKNVAISYGRIRISVVPRS